MFTRYRVLLFRLFQPLAALPVEKRATGLVKSCERVARRQTCAETTLFYTRCCCFCFVSHGKGRDCVIVILEMGCCRVSGIRRDTQIAKNHQSTSRLRSPLGRTNSKQRAIRPADHQRPDGQKMKSDQRSCGKTMQRKCSLLGLLRFTAVKLPPCPLGHSRRGSGARVPGLSHSPEPRLTFEPFSGFHNG